VDKLIDAFKLLPAAYRLLLVGYGPLEKKIIDKIQQDELVRQIRIVSDCSNPVLFYQRASCLVLTSSFEGFPNVLLEANAMGCPVVVYKTKGGAAEIVSNETGVYISPDNAGDLNALASAIESVCNNSQHFDRERIAAITYDRYNVKKIVSSYLCYIEETINHSLKNDDA